MARHTKTVKKRFTLRDSIAQLCRRRSLGALLLPIHFTHPCARFGGSGLPSARLFPANESSYLVFEQDLGSRGIAQFDDDADAEFRMFDDIADDGFNADGVGYHLGFIDVRVAEPGGMTRFFGR